MTSPSLPSAHFLPSPLQASTSSQAAPSSSPLASTRSVVELAKLLKSGYIDVVALMGPSGVGKSTLLRLLSQALKCSSLSVDDLVIDQRVCEEAVVFDYIRDNFAQLAPTYGSCNLVIDSNDDPKLLLESLGPSGLGKRICFISLYRPLDNLVEGFVSRAIGREPNRPIELIPLRGLGFCLSSFLRFFPLQKEASENSLSPLTPEGIEAVGSLVRAVLEQHQAGEPGFYYVQGAWEKFEEAYSEGAIYPTAHRNAFAIDVSEAGLKGPSTSLEDLKGEAGELFKALDWT